MLLAMDEGRNDYRAVIGAVVGWALMLTPGAIVGAGLTRSCSGFGVT
jgi:hypothetical protein